MMEKLKVGSRIYKQSKYSGVIAEILVITRLTKTMAFSKNDNYKFKTQTLNGLANLISRDNNDKSFHYILETKTSTETLKENFWRQNDVLKLENMNFEKLPKEKLQKIIEFLNDDQK